VSHIYETSISAHTDGTHTSIALMPNQPPCYIHTTQLHTKCRQPQPQTPLVRFVAQLVVHFAVQQIYNKLNQWSLSHTVCAMHFSHRPISARGAINIRLPTAIYMVLMDCRCAVAKFSESRMWDKVSDGSTLFLEIY